jgi:hypothetical protein
MYTDIMIPVTIRPEATVWTVARTAEHHVRLSPTSDTAGGPFAEIRLRVEPYVVDQHNAFTSLANPSTSGFFGDVDELIHGVIDGVSFFLSERAEQGQPLVGVGVVLLSLRAHPIDSSRGAFVRVAVRAMRELCALDGMLIRLPGPADAAPAEIAAAPAAEPAAVSEAPAPAKKTRKRTSKG